MFDEGWYKVNQKGEWLPSKYVKVDEAIEEYQKDQSDENLVKVIHEIADLEIQRQILLFFKDQYSSDNSPEEVDSLILNIEQIIKPCLAKIGFGDLPEDDRHADLVMRSKYSLRALKGCEIIKLEQKLGLKALFAEISVF